jgi:prepilin peptidase CpaA
MFAFMREPFSVRRRQTVTVSSSIWVLNKANDPAEEIICDMPTALKLILIAVVLIAAIYDLRFRRIPNWLNLSGVILGLGVNTFLFARSGLLLAVLGIACSLAVYVPLYLIRGMGAGDVKLMAAVGAITGPWNWLGIFVATALLGGVVSIVFIAFKGRFHQTCFNVALIVTELGHLRLPSKSYSQLDVRDPRAVGMPHGTLIAVGTLGFLIVSRNVSG